MHTHPLTHPHTGPITIHCAAASAQCKKTLNQSLYTAHAHDVRIIVLKIREQSIQQILLATSRTNSLVVTSRLSTMLSITEQRNLLFLNNIIKTA